VLTNWGGKPADFNPPTRVANGVTMPAVPEEIACVRGSGHPRGIEQVFVRLKRSVPVVVPGGSCREPIAIWPHPLKIFFSSFKCYF
jgi:hypothetical protein